MRGYPGTAIYVASQLVIECLRLGAARFVLLIELMQCEDGEDQIRGKKWYHQHQSQGDPRPLMESNSRQLPLSHKHDALGVYGVCKIQHTKLF